jgi:hypothetical protein
VEQRLHGKPPFAPARRHTMKGRTSGAGSEPGTPSLGDSTKLVGTSRIAFACTGVTVALASVVRKPNSLCGALRIRREM